MFGLKTKKLQAQVDELRKLTPHTEASLDDLKCSIEWIKMRSQYPNAIPIKLGASNEEILRIAAQENGFEFKKSWSPKANEMYEVWAPKQTQIEQLEDRLWAIEERLERKNEGI